MRPPRGVDPGSIDTSLVECLVVVVPEMTSLSSVGAALAELVETAAIRILDLVVVTRRRSDHEVHVLEPVASESLPDMLITRELGGLLSENDIALAATSLLPGAVGLVMLIEDRWASPLSSAAKRAGGWCWEANASLGPGSRLRWSIDPSSLATPPRRYRIVRVQSPPDARRPILGY